jgi:hypothetical protein
MLSDDPEIDKHCREFMDLKGVGRQRGCDGCEAGEAECWKHFCETVLKPRYKNGGGTMTIEEQILKNQISIIECLRRINICHPNTELNDRIQESERAFKRPTWLGLYTDAKLTEMCEACPFKSQKELEHIEKLNSELATRIDENRVLHEELEFVREQIKEARIQLAHLLGSGLKPEPDFV